MCSSRNGDVCDDARMCNGNDSDRVIECSV